jgi:uncharacterized lipoprotein YajG
MKKLVTLAAILLLQACAFTDATLKVEHDSNADITGPLSEAKGIDFSSPQLEDARQDKARIGWKKNGFGANTADITSEEDVDVILENAIIDAIKDNSHSVTDNGSVAVSGTVDRFWFETDVNVWSIEFIGDIQATLKFVDTSTGSTIYESSYSGNYKEKTAAGYVKTWTEVMGKALDNFIEDIVFDEDLSEALSDYK